MKTTPNIQHPTSNFEYGGLRRWANAHPRTVVAVTLLVWTLVLWAYAERNYLAWWQGRHFPDDWQRLITLTWIKSFLHE